MTIVAGPALAPVKFVKGCQIYVCVVKKMSIPHYFPTLMVCYLFLSWPEKQAHSRMNNKFK